MIRRALHFVTAADGTKIAWHAHEPEAPAPGVPSVVLTNGIGTTENFWKHLIDELTRDRRVAHWDYRAHGSSQLSKSGDYSLQTQAADLAQVTDAVITHSEGPAPIHIAFSMGVAVLLELYRTRPERVRAMVLIGGSPDAPGSGTALFKLPGSMWAARKALAAFTPVAGYLRPALRAIVKTRVPYDAGRLMGLLQPLAPRDDIQVFLTAIAQMDMGAYLATLRGLMEAHGSDVLPRVKVPVLILAAQKDTLMPMSQMKALRDALPAAKFVEIPDAGHAGMLEAGQRMASEIRAFLGSVDPRGPLPRSE